MPAILLWLALAGLALGAEEQLFYGKPSISCNPGWTGPTCENPICNVTKRLYTHDGQLEEGETITYGTSETCNGIFEFYVDAYFKDTFITLALARGSIYPNGVLTGPKGEQVTETSIPDEAANRYKVYYQDLQDTHGTGRYTFTYKSLGSAACFYLVTAKTTLVVDGGFVTDPRDDYVQTAIPDAHQGVNRMPRENVSTYFAFSASSVLSYPGEPLQVTITMLGDYPLSFDVKKRFGCNAPSFIGPFTCPKAGVYGFLSVSGVDMLGNQWQRFYNLQCLASGPPPTSTQPPPDECFNGGILVNGGQDNAECYCGQYFEGYQCEYKRCFNNGFLGTDGNCYCQTGYTGAYCQDVKCTTKSETTFNVDARALTFVVRSGTSMVAQIMEIENAAQNIRAYFRPYPAYFQAFNLIVFGNGNILDIQQSTDWDSFISAIQNLKIDQDVGCDDSIFMALSTAISLPEIAAYKRSPIFVFSDGLSDDDENAGLTLLHQLAFFRGQIFFMLTNSFNGQCVIDMAAQGYRTMRYIAWFSHGLVSHVTVSELAEATTHLASATYRTNYLLTNDLLDTCNKAPKYQAFFIDENIKYFFVIATGTGLQLTITNPDRVVSNPEVFFMGNNNTYIWQVSPQTLPKGSYLLSMTATGKHPCQYRVLGMGQFDLFVGISGKISQDFQYQQPILNQESHIVAHINAVQLPDSSTISAEATIWTNEGESETRTVLYASNGYFRDQCDYFLYFGAWTCTSPYQFFYVNVYITDRSGFAIQRTTTGFCSTINVTPAPDDGCLNGGVAVNGSCLCPPQWNGDKCQTIRCLNDGTVVGDTLCTCVDGFGGDYCQLTSCYYRNTNAETLWSPNRRSLSFLVHSSIPTRSTVRAISDVASRLVEDIAGQHSQWISHYHVIRFSNTEISWMVNSPNPNAFLSGLRDAYLYSVSHSEVSCGNLTVLESIMAVLQSNTVTYQGIIYIFLDGYMKVDVNLLASVFEMLELTRVQVNVAMLAESPCGHTLTEAASQNLMNVVGFSGGQWLMVMPSNAAPVVSMIPTLYRSSYIYENFVTDCTKAQTFYFPIDSQMQAFTVYIVGEMPDDSYVQYYNPSGEKTFPYTVWRDVGLGSRYDQIIQQCDDGWDLLDNRCWQYSFEATTWMEARSRCHAQGAVLATVYSEYEQQNLDVLGSGLDFWIGLNDMLSHGNWLWDQLGDTPLSLLSTQYSHWSKGQPDLQSMEKQCVVNVNSGGSSGWFNRDCSEKHIFMCLKHAYNVDLEPSSTSVDLLPRGIWKAIVKTTDGPCYIQVFGQSGIQQFNEYTIDEHMDVGDPQPHAKANDNRIISHMTNQQLSGVGIEGHLQYAHFYTMNLTIIQAQTYDERFADNCAFEYMSTGFKCPDYTFQALSTGVDRFGYMYQRIQPVKCMSGPTKDGDCLNQGVFQNGRCYCPPHWGGDLCEERQCRFGDNAEISTQCVCYYGYIGDFCEYPICTRRLNITTATPDNKTLVLVVDAGLDALIAASLSDTIKSVITKVTTQFPYWFMHYTGVVFREDGVTNSISNVIESDSPTDFLASLTTELSQPYTPTKRTRPIMGAVNKVLSSDMVQPRSPTFIVTSSSASDYNRESVVLTQLARKHAYIYTMIVGDNEPPGGTNYTDPSVGVIYELTYISGGRFYQTPPTSSDLEKFWTSTMALLYDSYYISSVQRNNCTGMTEYIQIGANSSSIVVDVLASVAHEVTLVDADGAPVFTLNSASSKTNTIVSGVTAGEPGLWKVTINPSEISADEGICSISVRGISTMDIQIAFSHDTSADGGLHADSADLFPLVGEDANRVVVQTNGGTMYSVQVFSLSERSLTWSSPLIERRRCSYQYISMSMFTCTEASVAVAVDGVDFEGHPIRRMIHVHCVGSFAPPTPGHLSTVPGESTLSPSPTTPLPTCDPSVPKFDIVLIFDASVNMGHDEFQRVVSAFFAIPLEVVIGPSNNRFMLGYYTGVTEYFPDASFIEDTDSYVNSLYSLETLGYSGAHGNNIYSIFASLNVSLFRDDPAVQRFVIFFSTTPWTDGPAGISYPDPQDLVKGFRNGGVNVMPIGYGPLANQKQLEALGCARMVNDRDELDALLPWIISLLCRTDQFC